MNRIFALRKFLPNCIETFVVFLFVVHISNITSLAFSVGERVSINGTEVAEGSIICFSNNTYYLCDKPYDPNIIGVVVNTPSIVVGPKSGTNLTGLVRTGEAYVRVLVKDGNPKRGDFITTSDTPGIGQVATQSGFVLGTVSSTSAAGNGIAQVFAQLSPGPRMVSGKGGSNNLMASFTLAMAAPNLSPLASLRYILASFFSIIAFGVGFIYFGKTASIGVEAFGRNPLASKKIGIGMLISFLLFMVITAIGLFIAYLILAL